MIRFASPWVGLAVLALPPMVLFFKRFENKFESSFRFSSQDIVKDVKPSMRVKLARGVIYLRGFCIFLIILAAMRPQRPIEETKIYVEGVDIVLTVDCSGSMKAMDFEMGGKRFDRLTVVKSVVEDFIRQRPNDRIGMVAFSSQAYSVCPLTLDHDWLERNLDRVNIGMIEDGTAIGSAISASLNRLRKTETKDKIIILLTDGRNNAGSISPLSAAEAAKALGIRIYTIGAGTKGPVPYPVEDMFGNTVLQPVEIEIDDDLLRKIADMTGGMYFRATDTEELWNIYEEIDKLEKTEIEEVGYNRYMELFGIFLFPALFVLLAEIVLTNTFLRRVP